MISPHIISTDGVSPHRRFEYWADEIVPTYLPTATSSRGRDAGSFQAHMSVAGGPSCAFFRVDASTFELKYRPAMARACELPDRYAYALAFVDGDSTDKMSQIDQGGRISQVKAGDCMLINLRREFTATIAGGGSRLYACLSESLVDAWIAPTARRVAEHLEGRRGWCRLLSNYLGGLSAMLVENAGIERLSGRASVQIGEHLALLLSMVMDERLGSAPTEYGPEHGRRHRLVQAMKAWVREHHADPGLSASDLARAFSISVRQVHRLIAHHGVANRTFLQWLHEFRLEAAEHMLTNKQFAYLTIADIAYACGYVDVGSFNRAFRAHRHTTPGAFRQAHDSSRRGTA